jgi:type III secretory pathway component EscV
VDFRGVEKTATVSARFGVHPGMPGKILGGRPS